jgi:1,4-dihydroxy-2-naphthoate octaprenyltransferase
MALAPILWVVWSVLVLFTAALYVYRSNLTKDEEDQIFLDDSFEHEKTAQAAIVAKVNKVQPILRVALWLVGAATLLVVAYYVVDIMNQFK